MNKQSNLRFSFRVQLPIILRVALFVAVLLVVAVVLFFSLRGCSFGAETITSGGKKLAEATPTDTFLPLNKRVLGFNGHVLYCYSESGDLDWQYVVADTVLDYSIAASNDRIALYNQDKLVLLDDRGEVTYSGKLAGQISHVSCGQALVAVEIQDENAVTVLSRNGVVVESISMGENTLMDFGLYSANDLLWTLTINLGGIKPISKVDIYKPGKELVNGYSSESQLYYKPIFYQDTTYIVGVDSIDVQAETSKNSYSTSIYGWDYADSVITPDGLYVLMTLGTQGNVPGIVRVFKEGSLTDLHLPENCLKLLGGNTGAYCVTPQALYLVPYQVGKIQTYAFKYTVTDVLCCAQSSQRLVVAAADGSVYLVKAP